MLQSPKMQTPFCRVQKCRPHFAESKNADPICRVHPQTSENFATPQIHVRNAGKRSFGGLQTYSARVVCRSGLPPQRASSTSRPAPQRSRQHSTPFHPRSPTLAATTYDTERIRRHSTTIQPPRPILNEDVSDHQQTRQDQKHEDPTTHTNPTKKENPQSSTRKLATQLGPLRPRHCTEIDEPQPLGSPTLSTNPPGLQQYPTQKSKKKIFLAFFGDISTPSGGYDPARADYTAERETDATKLELLY